jgi:hypothetical protein
MMNSTGNSNNTSSPPAPAGGLIDLVDLLDFNVQLTHSDNAARDNFALMDVVTAWMNDSFKQQLEKLQYTTAKGYAAFDTVILLERKQRMLLESMSGNGGSLRGQSATTSSSSTTSTTSTTLSRSLQAQLTTTALLKGAALFTKNATQQAVPMDVVQFLETVCLTNKTGLLSLLQNSSMTGIVDDSAYVQATSNSGAGGNGNAPAAAAIGSMQVIIIIAVVVAVVALAFLVLAGLWAWRYDRRNREAYLANNVPEDKRTDPTGSNSTAKSKEVPTLPVQHIVSANVYPESVISEDISTSLSQYYKGPYSTSTSNVMMKRNNSNQHLNDAASVSSMESYGYSLDGYAASIMPGTVQHSVVRADEEDDDEEENLSL